MKILQHCEVSKENDFQKRRNFEFKKFFKTINSEGASFSYFLCIVSSQ